MNKIIPVVLLSAVLSGCGGGDSDPFTSPLLGVWITELCEQAIDNNGVPVDSWVRGLYEFTVQGTIRRGSEVYSDANCVTLVSTTAPSDLTVPFTYKDNGPELLQEGINGAALFVEFGSGDQVASVNGFYTINNGSLCFSEAFTFGVSTIGVSESGSLSINFNNCLARP